ncbi:MAG: NAD(P)-dependent oxidoreductase [Pseudomonadota bacterium]
MLTHHLETPKAPSRTVIIGSNSFVGKALIKQLEEAGAPVVALGRAQVDLAQDEAGAALGGLLRADDTVVAISAKAPCRNVDDFFENAKMIRSLVQAFETQPVAHVVNISSDAVYPDEPVPLSETVPAAPGSMHGAMHLAREVAFGALGLPLAILRPTLIYGASDPHNGYGPNQFRRKANAGEEIVLFGEGEERRDHVCVDDVAELTARVIMHRSTGLLNVATGTVTSFRDIAEAAVRLSGRDVGISGRPRTGPMPHSGYRPFDPAATQAAFPDFSYIDLETGMRDAQATEFKSG